MHKNIHTQKRAWSHTYTRYLCVSDDSMNQWKPKEKEKSDKFNEFHSVRINPAIDWHGVWVFPSKQMTEYTSRCGGRRLDRGDICGWI